MTVSRIATTNAPAAVGPYSQGVSTGQGAGSLVFVSGQVPLDPATGALVEGDIQAQAEQVLKNVGAILAEAGLGYDDVVKTTVLLADIADFAAVNEVYARYFTGETLPARAAFGVAALPLGAAAPDGAPPHRYGVSDPAGGATRSLGSFPVPRPRGVLSSRAPRVALPMADGVTAGKDEARPAAAESPAGQDPRRGFMRGGRCRPRAFLSSSASEGSARCCPSAPS